MNEGDAGTAVGGVAVESQLAASRAEVSRLSLLIEQRERIFDGIFSSITDFAYAFDREGRFVFINKALLDLWGMKLEDAVGKNFHELPYPDDLATRLQSQIEEVFVTGRQVTDETPYTNPEGKTGYYEYIFCPVRGANDSIELVAGSTRDITKRKQTEQRLVESEEQYRTLFNSIDEGFCIAEVIFDDRDRAIDYRFLEVNPAFMKQSGLTNVTGKRVRGELVPDQEEFWFETYGRVALTGEPAKFENFTEPLDRWFEVFAFRIGNPDDRKIAIIFTDVTERKRAEDAIRQLDERNREILESIGDSVFAVDREWRFTYANPRAERLLEREPGDLIGKNIWEEYPGLTTTEFGQVYQRVADGGVAEQVTAFYPDHDRWYDVSCYPAPSGITVYFRDVSERVRAEEALREADRRKDEFLATLAHELRNPLAPIRSGLEVLRRVDGDREATHKTLDMIERQTNQVVRLVDDLLDVSRITRGKIRLRKERFPLRQAVEMAIETSQREIDESGNELLVTMPSRPLYLEADLTRTAQIFLNILNNAAKFSPPGGTIRLAVERLGGEAVISIRDQGRGIPPESLSKIFDIFGQVEPATRRDRSGLGIGLSVVKQLTEMHGGSVEAYSEGPGKGSKFVVRLPIVDAPEQVAEKTSTPAPTANPNGRRKIMVVDDNRDAAVMLETLLTLQGHEVRTAFDGIEALEAAREFEPDVCLLDIGLPGINGLELAQEIRKFLPDSLLVSVSGWGQEQDRQRSHDHGIDHHLVKPVDFTTLLNVVRSKEKLVG